MKIHGPRLIHGFAENVSTRPTWTAADEGRFLYVEDEDKYVIGNDADWRKLHDEDDVVPTELVLIVPGVLAVGDDQAMPVESDQTFFMQETRGRLKTAGTELLVDIRTGTLASETSIFTSPNLTFGATKAVTRTADMAKTQIAKNDSIVLDINQVTGSPADLCVMIRGYKLMLAS